MLVTDPPKDTTITCHTYTYGLVTGMYSNIAILYSHGSFFHGTYICHIFLIYVINIA